MWWILFACQAPFGADRHDLVGFRVAALALTSAAPGDPVNPSAALVVDGHLWSDDPVDLRWYWVDDEDEVIAIDDHTPIDATGPAPTLWVPRDERLLALVARHGDDEERVFTEIHPPPGTAGPVDTLIVQRLDLTVDGVSGADLQLAAREALPADPTETLEPGGFARIEALAYGEPLVRWMATAGTFFELALDTTDWAAGDLRLDGDEIDDGRTTLDPGPVSFLALALGEPGETSFRATELYLGDEPPGLWVEGRYVLTDAVVPFLPGERVRGTLRADDASPTGLRLDGGAAELGPGDAYPAPPCEVPVSGPFDPSWLLRGWCTRAALDGAEVVVEPEVSR